MLRTLLLLAVLAISVVLASCGSSATERLRSPADQLAVVTSACEENGGSSLLPRQDTSSVPDTTPVICRCWVNWMREHLASRDRDSLATDVVLSASAMSLTNSLLDHLARVLRTCEARLARGTHGAAPDPATSSPGP